MVYYIAKSFGKVIKRVFLLAKHIFFFFFFFELQALLKIIGPLNLEFAFMVVVPVPLCF